MTMTGCVDTPVEDNETHRINPSDFSHCEVRWTLVLFEAIAAWFIMD